VDETLTGSSSVIGDPFAIDIYQIGAGSIIRDNWIGHGTAHHGGQGILCQGAKGTAEAPIYIDSNVIDASCQVSATDTKSVGLYFRWPSQNSHMEQQYVNICHNTIRAYCDSDDGTDYIPVNAEAVRLHLDSAYQHIGFYENRIFALRADSLSPSAAVMCYAVSFSRGDTTAGAYDTIKYNSVPISDWAADISDIDIHGNYIYSHEHCYSMSSDAISEYSCSNITTYGDTLSVMLKSNCDDATIYCGPNAYQGHARNNWFINTTFQGQADTTFKWGVFGISGPCDTCTGRSCYYARTLELHVIDSDYQPIDGASLAIKNNYGIYAMGIVTDENGVYRDTLPRFFFWDNNDVKECSVIDSSYIWMFIASNNEIVDTLENVEIWGAWSGVDTLMLGTPATPVRHGKALLFKK